MAGKSTRRWSGGATRKSTAPDLEKGVFTWRGPERIARSLKRSAEQSARRKSGAFRSAISMLTYYMNRAGGNLPDRRRRVLNQAKDKLRWVFGRADPGG